jgi:hypothetical protein
MARAQLALLILVPALACASCAGGKENPQANEEAPATAPLIVDKALIGTFTADTMMVGKLAQLVLKTDGTFHSGMVVACVRPPCYPVTQDGTYKLEMREGYKYLRLFDTLGEPAGSYQYALRGDTLRLRRMGGVGGTWQSLMRDEKSWCAAPSDCSLQNLPVGPCGGEWSCAQNACWWQCGPIASNPGGG